MNNSNLEVVITAKDEASAKLKSFSNRIESLQPTFQRMAVAGTVAFTAIAGVVASSVNAYAESERNQRQLEHAIVNVSKGTMDQVKAVNELTGALQKKSGIDGDALNVGVAQLSTFGLQSKSVVALTKSLADLTVNQKGVNASSDDYIQSANTMAKALNGQFGVLEKSGIRFTDAQQRLIQFGTETERVKAIQEGFAQNLRETTDTVAGYDVEMAKLKQQFGEIQETIGKSLQPVLTKLAEILVPILNKISEWITQNPNLTTGILIAVAVFGALAGIIGIIGMALPAIIVGFGVLGGTFGIVTGIVVALAFAVHNVTKIMDLLLNHSDMVLLGLRLYWQDFVNFIKNKVLTPISTYFKDVWTGIKITVMEVIDGIKAYFKPLVDMIEGVLSKLDQIASKVKGSISSAASTVGGWIQSTGRFAQGGNAMGGSTYMVGENGPELFTPSRNGVVIPNNQLGSGGKSIVVNILGGTYLSREVALEIGDVIIDSLKQVARI